MAEKGSSDLLPQTQRLVQDPDGSASNRMNHELENEQSPISNRGIKVIVRVKPAGIEQNVTWKGKRRSQEIEIDDFDSKPCVTVASPTCIRLLKDDGNYSNEKVFSFDRVLTEGSSQEDLYCLIKDDVRSSVQGRKCAVVTFGAIASGKTFTMMGKKSDFDQGIVPRAVRDLFYHMENERSSHPSQYYFVELSYVELYNGNFRNLLANVYDKSNETGYLYSSALPAEAKSQDKFEIIESQNFGTLLSAGAQPSTLRHQVKSVEEAMLLISRGNKMRSLRPQKVHNHSYDSSRSHAILTFHIECHRFPDPATGSPATTNSRDGSGPKMHAEIAMGSLTFVDLAGIEKLSPNSTTPTAAMTETQHINLSLNALGDVLSTLAKRTSGSAATPSSQRQSLIAAFSGQNDASRFTFKTGVQNASNASLHVPYLNSKLTHLLKEVFGGATRTTFIATIHTAAEHYRLTATTLMYAAWAMKVGNPQQKDRFLVNVYDGWVVEKNLAILKMRKTVLERSKELRTVHLLQLQQKESESGGISGGSTHTTPSANGATPVNATAAATARFSTPSKKSYHVNTALSSPPSAYSRHSELVNYTLEELERYEGKPAQKPVTPPRGDGANEELAILKKYTINPASPATSQVYQAYHALQEQFVGALMQIDALEKENAELKDTVERYQLEAVALQERYRSIISTEEYAQLQSQFEQLQREKMDVLQGVEDSSTMIVELQEQLRLSSDNFTKKSQQCAELVLQFNALESRVKAQRKNAMEDVQLLRSEMATAIQMKEDEIASLNDKLRVAETVATAKSHSIVALETQLKARQETHRLQSMEMEQRVAQLQASIVTQQEQRGLLQADLLAAQIDVVVHINSNHGLQALVSEWQDKHQLKEEERAELQSKLNDVTACYKELERKYLQQLQLHDDCSADHSGVLAAKEVELQQACEENQRLRQDLDNLHQQHLGLTIDIGSLEDQLSETRRERDQTISTLEEQLNRAQQAFDEGAAKHSAELGRLSKDKDLAVKMVEEELSSVMRESAEVITDLQQKLAAAISAKEELLAQFGAQLNEAVRGQQESSAEFHVQIAEMMKHHDETESRLRKQLAEATAALDEAHTELALAQQQRKDLETKHAQKETHEVELELALKQSKEASLQLQAENDELSERLKRALDDIARRREEADASSKELSTQIMQLSIEKSHCAASISALEIDKSVLEKGNAALQEEIAALRAKLEEHHRQSSQTDLQREQEVEQNQKTIKALEAQIVSLQQGKEQFLAAMREQMSALQSDIDSSREKSEQKLLQFQEKLTLQSKELELKEEALAQLSAENAKLKQEVVLTKQQCSLDSQDFMEKLQLSSSRIYDLQQQVSVKSMKLSAMLEKSALLKNQVDELVALRIREDSTVKTKVIELETSLIKRNNEISSQKDLNALHQKEIQRLAELTQHQQSRYQMDLDKWGTEKAAMQVELLNYKRLFAEQRSIMNSGGSNASSLSSKATPESARRLEPALMRASSAPDATVEHMAIAELRSSSSEPELRSAVPSHGAEYAPPPALHETAEDDDEEDELDVSQIDVEELDQLGELEQGQQTMSALDFLKLTK